MRVFKTEYFSKIIENKLNNLDKNDLRSTSYINGFKEDFKGKKFEEVLVDLCNKKDRTNEEESLIKNLFKKEVESAEVLLNKYKADIVVYFKDKTRSYISLKYTKSQTVGALEVTKNSFAEFFNDEKLTKSISKYEETEYSSKLFKNIFHQESVDFEEYISKNQKKYLKYVLCGTGKNLPPDTIIFLDKKNNYLYISSVDEYINILLKYGGKGTFNTYTNLTRTSKTHNLKIKVANPIRIKKFKQNNYLL